MSAKSSIAWDTSLIDENESSSIVAIIVIMIVFIILSISTKIGMKLWRHTALQIENISIILSLVCSIVDIMLR